MSQVRPVVSARGGPQQEYSLNAVTLAICLLFMIFMTGGITRLLTGGTSDDEALEATEGFVMVRLTAAFLYTSVFVLAATHWRRVRPALSASSVIWIPVLLAVISIGWSYLPELTLKRAVPLVGTTMGGVVVASLLGPRRFSVYLAYILAVVVGISALTAILIPDFGKHTSTSGLTWSALHAGRWRGLYWHKNGLGPVSSITFAYWYLMRPVMKLNTLVYIGVLVIAVVTTAFAASAQGIAQLALPFAVQIFLTDSYRPFRTITVVFLLASAVLLSIFFNEFAALMGAILNRDVQFSGRMDIWNIILSYQSIDPVVGGGYGAGFEGGLADALQSSLFQRLVNAHNGFLQQYVDLGWAGVITLLLVVASYIRYLVQNTNSQAPEFRLALYFMAQYLSTNMLDNYALRGQEIYWFLMAAFLTYLASGALKPVDALSAEGGATRTDRRRRRPAHAIPVTDPGLRRRLYANSSGRGASERGDPFAGSGVRSNPSETPS